MVKDNEGKGVSGGTVEIYRFGRLAAAPTTTGNGTYALDGVPSGNNLLKIQFSVADSIADTHSFSLNDVWVVGEDGQATKISLITDVSNQFKIMETRFSFYGGQIEEIGQQEDVIEIKEPVIDAVLIKEDIIAFISEGKDKDTATFSAVMKIAH